MGMAKIRPCIFWFLTLTTLATLSLGLSAATVAAAAPKGGSPSPPPVQSPLETSFWLPTPAGQVLNFGKAASYGSVPGTLNEPIVGMAPTPDDLGYWLVASDGGIFSFGDAKFHGSTGNI